MISDLGRVGSLVLLAFVALSGCDTLYHGQDVVSGVNRSTNVRVLDLTAETVLVANRDRYEPKSLPAAFGLTAGTRGQYVSGGALPEPAYTAQNRPASLETRLPDVTTPKPYRIGVGDVLLFATPSGSSVEELAGLLAAQNNRQGYTVQDDGAIAVPNVGRIEVAGLTIEEAEARMFQRLISEQIDPTFSIEIASFNSQQVSVGGAVSDPGVFNLNLTPLYLDQVIARAGGVTAPSMEYVTVRLYRDGTLYQVPLEKLYDNSGLQRILLQAGDSVFVDTAYQLDEAAAYFQQQIQLANFRQGSRLAALNALSAEIDIRRSELNEQRNVFNAAQALDAVDRDYVYITGEVQSAGRLTLPYNRQASLSDALYDTGRGLVPSSDPREIYVLRGSSDPLEFGAVTAWHLNAKNAANLVLATRFELRPNDVIFVAEKPVTRWNRTISQITPTIINLGASQITD